MGHRKRNSIFSSFSKMRRKSKSNAEVKKSKSSGHLESNSNIDKSNSVKNSSVTKNDELEGSGMKNFMSVSDKKGHSRLNSHSKKKGDNEILNIKTDSLNAKQDSETISSDFSVKETNVMIRDYDPKTGRKMINNYVVVKEVGRGCHGKVKLCYDINTNEEYAMKIVNKKLRRRFYYRMTLNQHHDAVNPYMEKIKREIAILKKCSHPHVVKLKEVIDSPESEKIYIILEYLDGGEVKWQVSQEEPKPVMTQDVARKVFRDVISGVGYLHHQGIVHRDIKPANLLWTSDGHVKISDFGVSCFMNTNNPNLSEKERKMNELELAKTAGSPAFFAPELCGINDDEVSNTVTQFAALLNSRTSNKSQNVFPRTPSNISSYSKLDVISSPRSVRTPSIISRVSDNSINKGNNDSKSINIPDDKQSQIDVNEIIVANGSNTNTNINTNNNDNNNNPTNNLVNDKSSYSSLQPSNEKFDIIRINDKQSTLSLNSTDISKNNNQKPRSIKWVQYPSKRSLSLSEGTVNNSSSSGSIINKYNGDDKSNVINLINNKSYSNRTHRSYSNNLNYSSNESLNLKRKISDASGYSSIINNNSNNNNSELKISYSSSYSTLNNKIRPDYDGKHNLKISSKSSLSLNIEVINDDSESSNVNINNNINSCMSPTEYEKTIPSESPLFVRRRCSQSSAKSNRIIRSQSSHSSSKLQFLDKNSSGNLVDKSSKSVLSGKRSYSSSITQLNNDNKNKDDDKIKEESLIKKTPHIDGKLIDIWAMGVTLYCLIFGNVPFTASTEFELLSVICHQELKFPEDIPISDSLRDLLTKILTKDPKARIGMKEIENHPWVTEDLNEDEKEEWFKFVSLNDDPLDVTEDEVKKALTLKDRIKKKLSKFTHSLNKFSGGLRRRTRSMPSVEITDKNLLKQNFNSNKNKKDSIVDSSITKKIESDNSNKNILINSTVARSNTAPNNSYSILNNINTSSHNNSTTSNNAIHSSNHNTDANISKVKSTIYSDTTLNIQSQNNSNSISNTINVIKGLNHGNNSSSKSKEPNVKSSHISTIPKTFLNKDIENLRNSDNNEEEDGDINEDSSGEILYMSFDRKFKKRNNTQTELVKRKQQ